MFTADDTSEVQKKCRFGLRKPPFYPLNYGNNFKVRSKKDEGRNLEIRFSDVDVMASGKLSKSRAVRFSASA